MLTHAEYQLATARVEELAERDPDPASDEGAELLALAARIEEYERKHFPHLFSNKTVITGNAE